MDDRRDRRGHRQARRHNPGGNDANPGTFAVLGTTLFFGAEGPGGGELYKLTENPPVLALSAKAQALAKQLVAIAGCDEDCSVTVAGKVKAKSKKKGKQEPGKGKSFTLEPAAAEVLGGGARPSPLRSRARTSRRP